MSERQNGNPATLSESQTEARRPRTRISQDDVPSYSLDQAMRVPRAIAEGYAFKPTRTMHVAAAMKMSPGSGPFRAITGAAVAYGLTTAGAFAPEIGITPLGMRVVRPTQPGDDLVAKREAILRPKVVGEFLRRYDGAALPPDQIGRNVLAEMGVPAERVDDVFKLIIENANSVGLIKDISGKSYVDLAGVQTEVGPTAPAGRSAPLPVTPTPAASVGLAPGVHINVEIHIAADATSETIEEIFRNMRRYVLSADAASTND